MASAEAVPRMAIPLQHIGMMRDDENATKVCCGKFDSGIERNFWTRVWQGVAIASLVVNICAMAIEGGAAAIAAGVFAVFIAPVVFVRQFTLQSTDTLRDVQNQLRDDVNNLQVENNKLSASNTSLETQVGRLKESEAKLDVIVKEQGSNVDSFVKLVKENRETLDAFKRAIRVDTINDIVKVILGIDRDMSAKFSDQELDSMELYMMTVPGVTYDHALLKQRFHGTDRDLASLLAIVQEIERDDLPAESRIFRLDEGEREAQAKFKTG